MSDFDPIALFEAQKAAAAAGAKENAKFERMTRDLFCTAKGREWLGMAMARINFMGSVFDPADGLSPTAAAYRDGARSVFSEILNSAAAAMPERNAPDDD